MKILLTSLVTLALTAGLVGSADAGSYRKKKRGHVEHYSKTYKHYPRSYGYRDEDDSIGGYYEHRLDAVRFGSQRWWKIYDEQRGPRG
jgi:hypothetical protein